jgi:hypothetical protein
MVKQVFGASTELLLRCGDPLSNLRPSELYNETWLHRVALHLFGRLDIRGSLLSLEPNARWISEGLLYSQFLPKYRGDELAERHSEADSALGHFGVEIGEKKQWVVKLDPDATQFVVGEAKLGARLSSKVTHCPWYDQAARTVACMAETLCRAGREPTDVPILGYYLLAPQAHMNRFGDLISKESITSKVKQRVEMYQSRHDDLSKKTEWLEQWFIPAITRIKINTIAWEDIVVKMSSRDPEVGTDYAQFYDRCREVHNVPTLT